MAGKSSKKIAAKNAAILKQLHVLVVAILSLTLLRKWFSNGLISTLKPILFNVPMLLCLYILERTGRPKYEVSNAAHGKYKLVNEGFDLESGGLTEYMKDIVYVSLFCNLGTVFFNTMKWWFLVLVCPAFIFYKLYYLKQQYFPGASASKADLAETTPAEPSKSKRQLKREKRGDKSQVRYR
ncbi:Snd2p [Kluyveromyces lactis]|uniref:KLLA0D05335p n=1 Tax=Kluyveromyces lactis (strain ATCC 8585 / CBS 2359 / DSM 70799 / NBRC 1267 / NRRL Y-1140 / WM37) TaxID=284590 RepID=Q6CRZ1_KLULA|nr:uncharacterized protein KLLA0_D05335g [Kluyveromyces lactis]CAH00394.1 KLLA0D05335p [Kluyveromyces lactis]|eukprot:XP_453298.1 uncharacterized protein KLLA0_D05335g [Kluyveromyces lactis]